MGCSYDFDGEINSGQFFNGDFVRWPFQSGTLTTLVTTSIDKCRIQFGDTWHENQISSLITSFIADFLIWRNSPMNNELTETSSYQTNVNFKWSKSFLLWMSCVQRNEGIFDDHRPNFTSFYCAKQAIAFTICLVIEVLLHLFNHISFRFFFFSFSFWLVMVLWSFQLREYSFVCPFTWCNRVIRSCCIENCA